MKRSLWLIILFLSLLLCSCIRAGDALEPIINITNPTNGTVKSGDNLVITGYALDDVGIKTLRVNGSDLLRNKFLKSERNKKLIRFDFTPTFIREGKWGAEIEVEDKSGRVTKMRYELEIDATLPSVKVIPPNRLGNDKMSVSGVARDNNLLERIVVNGIEVSFSAAKEKFFTVDVPYNEVVLVTVYDQAGNSRNWETKPKN